MARFYPSRFISSEGRRYSAGVAHFLFFHGDVCVGVLYQGVDGSLVVDDFQFANLLIYFCLGMFRLGKRQFQFVLHLRIRRVRLSQRLFVPSLANKTGGSNLRMIRLYLGIDSRLVLFTIFNVAFLRRFLRKASGLILDTSYVVRL